MATDTASSSTDHDTTNQDDAAPAPFTLALHAGEDTPTPAGFEPDPWNAWVEQIQDAGSQTLELAMQIEDAKESLKLLKESHAAASKWLKNLKDAGPRLDGEEEEEGDEDQDEEGGRAGGKRKPRRAPAARHEDAPGQRRMAFAEPDSPPTPPEDLRNIPIEALDLSEEINSGLHDEGLSTLADISRQVAKRPLEARRGEKLFDFLNGAQAKLVHAAMSRHLKALKLRATG